MEYVLYLCYIRAMIKKYKTREFQIEFPCLYHAIFFPLLIYLLFYISYKLNCVKYMYIRAFIDISLLIFQKFLNNFIWFKSCSFFFNYG